MEESLKQLLAEIVPPDAAVREQCRAHWNRIAKPIGSFGLLEDMVSRIGSIQGTDAVHVSRRTVVVFCGDHGVVEEGVTQTGSEVTALCAQEIADGNSNVNAIAASVGCDVLAVDAGMRTTVEHERLLNRKIGFGTQNFTKGAAMERSDCIRALLMGIQLAQELKAKGNHILLTGEMGIGNTTSAAALAKCCLPDPVESLTGRGAGLTDEGLTRKIHAVKRALQVNSDRLNDPIDALSALGGYEIAAMTGLFLGGAIARIPVVIDGVISAAAACFADWILPDCHDFMLASHTSEEPAAKGLLARLQLEAPIHARLRLGEGTGGLLLLPLLDAAVALYRNSHQFEKIGMEPYKPL